MDPVTIGLLIAGLVLLTLGGELLVRGSSALAAIAGISPLVIGLTVVAFGTSAPELAVSVQAGLTGASDLAIGNVVGSNIFNILFVLGTCALVAPLIVSIQLVRREVPILIVVSFMMFFMALDGTIGIIDGLILTLGIIIYVAWSVISSLRETAAAEAEAGGRDPTTDRSLRTLMLNLTLLVGGLGLLVLGSRWLVDGAVGLARALGVSDVIIGLTIVAAGTSLPEVVTSVVATLRNERDIAIGNAIGSSIFNVLCIVGIASLVTPGGLNVPTSVINFDMPVMLAATIACLPIFFSGMTIARWEGALFFGYYIAYTTYLVLAATQHDALPAYSTAMITFVIPLTVITLVVTGGQALLRHRRGENGC
ncbi:calcium/sodium antiporter [Candidatus Viridilinea mediisalina]|uniref:Sodium:calcium antiporter n=1 Tax=Candidatus Viridilinea mediisalina TaxID=2024553 RepID=A0A2A6RLA8_9CHLR|nr:calcium/sodium antiporter [Candidatus Viridilinea mediisalina]PDW03669.1 sodium:calcium antiporter [Candidatus Viridilinea mediisalina]